MSRLPAAKWGLPSDNVPVLDVLIPTVGRTSELAVTLAGEFVGVEAFRGSRDFVPSLDRERVVGHALGGRGLVRGGRGVVTHDGHGREPISD